MKSLTSHWTEIRRRLAQAPRLLIALDYDGVLTPIRRHSRQARLPGAMRVLLRQLRRPDICLAIVSGRGLLDLTNKVRLSGMVLSGNHGLDIQFPGKRERRGSHPRFRRALAKASAELRFLTATYPGSLLEDKGLGLTLNYQKVAPRAQAALLRGFRRWSRHRPSPLRVTPQKMSFDIRPNLPWNKGAAVRRIWRHVGRDALPMYLGDDRTDEDVFRALRHHGITVFVGAKQRSQAEYHLPSQNHVLGLLRRIRDLRTTPT